MATPVINSIYPWLNDWSVFVFSKIILVEDSISLPTLLVYSESKWINTGEVITIRTPYCGPLRNTPIRGNSGHCEIEKFGRWETMLLKLGLKWNSKSSCWNNKQSNYWWISSKSYGITFKTWTLLQLLLTSLMFKTYKCQSSLISLAFNKCQWLWELLSLQLIWQEHKLKGYPRGQWWPILFPMENEGYWSQIASLATKGLGTFSMEPPALRCTVGFPRTEMTQPLSAKEYPSH